MPPTGTTNALATARASAPGGVIIVETLTLTHSKFPGGVYWLTNAPAAFSAKDENGVATTYQPYPFAIVLPTVDGAGNQDLKVSLSNADLTITKAVQAAHVDPTERIVAIYRVYLSSLDATQQPQSAPLRLEFDTIQFTEEAVTGVAGRSDTLNRRFPGVWYDVAHFPGLDR